MHAWVSNVVCAHVLMYTLMTQYFHSRIRGPPGQGAEGDGNGDGDTEMPDAATNGSDASRNNGEGHSDGEGNGEGNDKGDGDGEEDGDDDEAMSGAGGSGAGDSSMPGVKGKGISKKKLVTPLRFSQRYSSHEIKSRHGMERRSATDRDASTQGWFSTNTHTHTHTLYDVGSALGANMHVCYEHACVLVLKRMQIRR